MSKAYIEGLVWGQNHNWHKRLTSGLDPLRPKRHYIIVKDIRITGRAICIVAVLMLPAAIACGITYWLTSSMTESGKPAKAAAVTPKELDESIEIGRRYLLRGFGPDGRFMYRVNLDPKVAIKEKYNILRHCGTMYALALCQARQKDVETADVLVRASVYLKGASFGPVPGKKGLLAAWSYPELTGGVKVIQAKLGATALGLLALVHVENVAPGTTTPKDLAAMADFIVYMQNANGAFCSKFIPSAGGKNHAWVSLYYPGEAILSLVTLYEHDKNTKWLAAADRGIAYLIASRDGVKSLPPDHWALLATGKLIKHSRAGKTKTTVAQLKSHAERICESMLIETRRLCAEPIAEVGLTGDGRTCSTATRLEGHLAALTHSLIRQDALRRCVETQAKASMRFLLDTQIRTGLVAGGMPRAARRLPVADNEYSKTFNRRAGEIRIDYVQHAISAMMQFEKFIAAGTQQ